MNQLRKITIVLLLFCQVFSSSVYAEQLPLETFVIDPSIPIIAYEDFDYEEDTAIVNISQLMESDADKGFSTGWKANSTLDGNISKTTVKIAGNGMVSVVGESASTAFLYRGLNTALDLTKDNEYYIKWKQYIYATNPSTSTSQKLEFWDSADTTATIMGGLLGDGGGREGGMFRPFLKYRNNSVTSDTSSPLPMETTYNLIMRISSSQSGADGFYLKVYPEGEAQPSKWNVQINMADNSVNNVVDFGSNAAASQPAGDSHLFGGLIIEEYSGSTRNVLLEAETLVNDALKDGTAQAITQAQVSLDQIFDGVARSELESKLRPLIEKNEQEKQNIEQALQVTAELENTDVNVSNVHEILETIEDIKAVITNIENAQIQQELLERLQAVEENLVMFKIVAFRTDESFDYVDGSLLSTTSEDQENGFSSGWKADADLSTSLDNSYTIDAQGCFSKEGSLSMYRGVTLPIGFDQPNDYYLKWSFEAESESGFAGIRLGEHSFGIMAEKEGLRPYMDFNSEIKASQVLPATAKYSALLRLSSDGYNTKASLMVYPYNQLPSLFWDIEHEIESHQVYSTIGIEADFEEGYTYSIYRFEKEEVERSCIVPITEIIPDLQEYKQLNIIEVADGLIGVFPDSIIKTLYGTIIGAVRQENMKITPRLDYLAVQGESKVGAILKAIVTVTDMGGNMGDTLLEWKSGGSVLSQDESFSVRSNYEGKNITLVATPINIFGEKGESKSVSVTIDKSISASGGSSGGGGSSSGFSGGGGSSSSFTPVQTIVTVPSATPKPIASALDTYQTTPKADFLDLENHWAKDDVKYLAERGIVKGANQDFFNPDDNITRAQFAALLVRVLGLYNTEDSIDFEDVAEHSWYKEDIEKISSAGIMTGNENRFAPDAFVTREEMAKGVALAYEYVLGDMEIGVLPVYTDGKQISPWAIEYINKCVSVKLMLGMGDGSFAPSQTATRAQTTVVIKRLFNCI